MIGEVNILSFLPIFLSDRVYTGDKRRSVEFTCAYNSNTINLIIKLIRSQNIINVFKFPELVLTNLYSEHNT